MPWVLHGITLDKLIVVVDLDLVQRVQCLVIALIVASADEVKLLGVWVLYTLEIVRKTTIVVWLHLDGLHSLVSDVQLINVL